MNHSVSEKRKNPNATCLVTLIFTAFFIAPAVAYAVGVAGQGTWEATLQGRDLDEDSSTFEAYYDTALNITWLTDANFAKTSGYTSASNGGLIPGTSTYHTGGKWTDGGMGWNAANAWAAQLSIGGYDGWRLPTLSGSGYFGCNTSYVGTDCGYNVNTSTSEMAHMYYITLGNKARYTPQGGAEEGWGLSNTGPFDNVQSGKYWTEVEYSVFRDYARFFNFYEGHQLNDYKKNGLYAWAVRSGDVLSVPEPQGITLAIVGFLVVGAVVQALRRR